ncbi:MAG TPA: cyclic nucleotide-binding domain-containing protein [Spirochaetia bacterium]|nr:cyclic nucleotide-binding domain-containing protein [Spirochaetia bacterium]
MRQLDTIEEVLISELGNAVIFKALTIEELRHLIPICEEWEYARDEIIITQDSISRYLYILLAGKVEVTVKGKEKETIAISTIQPGEVFGEASIFMDVRRIATVSAKEESRILSISREKLFAFCNDHPKTGLKIFTFIIYSLLRRLDSVNQDLAYERETAVTEEDLEALKKLFPVSLDDMF